MFFLKVIEACRFANICEFLNLNINVWFVLYSADVYPVKDACQGIKRKHLEDSPAGENSTGNILEQQRFVLKLSFEKLRKLEDPESCLRRSVLINNTLKYLHTQIYPVETPCYEFYTGFNPSDHHRMNISPLVRKRSLTNIQTEVVPQQSSINSNTNSTEMQVPELSNPRGFTTEKHDKNPLPATLDDEHDSMFCELDNVFHNFICALET